MCREICKRSSSLISHTRSQGPQQLLAAEAVTQHKINSSSDLVLRLNQRTSINSVEELMLHPSSESSNTHNSIHHCARGGNDDVGGVRAINSHLNRGIGGRGVNGNAGMAGGSVGIGATVVMVLLAAINVTVYLPAALLEIICILVQEETLMQSTRNMSESLCRFLFENLCFAHALNFFVYAGR